MLGILVFLEPLFPVLPPGLALLAQLSQSTTSKLIVRKLGADPIGPQSLTLA